MEARLIRQKFVDFFKEKGHAQIPSAPVLPENDPTVLFTTAGMHPLVPYLMGEVHAQGTRLTNFQKCVRTGDIDEVGDESHLTFFEMLGNWSLGDYFKEDAIKWSYEFLTSEKWLNIDPGMLSVTVFGGDKDFPHVPRDDESAEIWKSVGMPEDRIAYMEGGVATQDDNWWGPAGQTGPCGPSTEMFYWVGEGEPHGNVATNTKDWLEIWNDVLMQYNKGADGKFEPLKQKNVDTGMGLERTAAVLQGKKSVYETELFTPILEKIGTLAQAGYEEKGNSFRIIADHLRAATIMAGDGVKPSNTDQGYVMRRLIRRAIRHGKLIGIEQEFTGAIAKKIIHIMSDIYPELRHEEEIIETLRAEEEKFGKTINQGLREFEKLISKLEGREIDGPNAFRLYDTYGFPIEMTEELARDHQLSVDKKGFDEAYQAHQEKSRSLSAGVFKGGLQDHSWETTRLHTATHLMHAALIKVLGPHATQRGSNITAERTRFDFQHPDKLSDEQVAEVEKYVNDAIASDHPVKMEIIPYEEAKARNAIGLFEDTYEEKVKVYDMGPWSLELCGGPHVEHLGQLSTFKIKKQESIGAGLRRIKAVLL
ncbi:MAG: alanine--tRNA ligase [Candidatus Peregrinibacteria bacterium]|nr:alanine--tRNA ligase [Candidatus Peregrinibacteria bacterium]